MDIIYFINQRKEILIKKIYQVEDSNITLDSIKQKEYYPKELDNEICSADALFIPFENCRDDYDILFAE